MNLRASLELVLLTSASSGGSYPFPPCHVMFCPAHPILAPRVLLPLSLLGRLYYSHHVSFSTASNFCPVLSCPVGRRRFSSNPPYAVTHISHGFLPPSEYHFGIVFPSSLVPLGPQEWALSYGDSDQVARLLLLTQADIDKLLVPVPLVEKRIVTYSVCTLPLASDVPSTLRLRQSQAATTRAAGKATRP